jgi:hypothetical protein
MLMGTKKLADELYSFTRTWDGEDVLVYSMKAITVDGIHSQYYNPNGGGQVHFAPMISWKRIDRGGDESWTCRNSDGPISELGWLKYGIIITEQEYWNSTHRELVALASA